MFWGLVVRHDKKYSHKVENSFHVSMATLDVSTAGKGPVELMLTVGDESFLLCRLSKEHPQQPLDLNFSEGESIIFSSRSGEGTVHMTGYNLENEFDEFGEEDSEEESEDEKMDTPKSENAKRKSEAKTPDTSKKMKLEAALKKKMAAEDSDSDEDLSDLDMSDFDDEEMEEMGEEASEEDSEDSSEEEAATLLKKAKTPQKQTPSAESGKKNKKKQMLTPQSMQKDQAPKYLGTPYPGKGTDSKPATPMTNGTESEKKKKNKKNKKKDSMGGSPALNQQKVQKKFIKGGIGLEDLKVGTGPDVAKGKFVQIYYEGKLKDTGKVFDSNKEGKGFKFKLGAGEVIKGMEFGLDGMKVGGRRKLTIPPKMGYGHQGAGKDIPPNSTLEFDIELKAVN